jgi:hypothetical protein
MNPVHHRSFIALDRLRPLRGIGLPSPNHVERLKAFAAALVPCFDHQPPQIVWLFAPFGKIGSNHLRRLLFTAWFLPRRRLLV